MDCLETRKKLSSYADGELGPSGRADVDSHLAGCVACSQDLEEQGALDMLLKDHFQPVPPEGYEDRLLLAVSQRIDGEGTEGGGKATGEDPLVFKSSPALQALNIPDRKPAEPEPAPASAATTATPAAPPPAAPSYRWPVAFVLAAAVVTGGFLVHKKMNPPLPAPGESATPTIGAAGGQAGAAAAPASADATVLAQASGVDGGAAEPAAAGDDGGVEDKSSDPDKVTADKGSARKARRSRRGKRTKAAKASGDDKTEPAVAAKPAAPKPAPSGKKSSLDSLIDNAIGGRPKAAATKAAPAKTVDSSLPEQLSMNQIRGGMRKIRNRIQACYDKFQMEGKATVKLTITQAGRVKDTLIKGKFFGTDTGSCVASAVKSAKFPKFRGKEMTIAYPFILQ